MATNFGGYVRLFADLPLGSETFIYVFLPLLIFEAALGSDVRRIMEDAAPILMLAVIATLITAAIVGLRKAEQVHGTVGAMDFRLTAEEAAQLEKFALT